MATSGLTTFTLNWDDILVQASSLVGGEDLTPNEAARANTALNLLFLDLSTRGVNLWCVERQVINTVVGTGRYYLPADTIEVLNVFTMLYGNTTARSTRVVTNPYTTVNLSSTVTVTIADHGAENGDFVSFSPSVTLNGVTLSGSYQVASVTQNTFTVVGTGTASSSGSGGGSVTAVFAGYTKLPMQSIPRDSWSNQAQTTAPGRPYLYWLDKQIPQPVLNFMPTPDVSSPYIGYYRKRRLQDVGTSQNTPDVPTYFLGTLVYGTAFFMSELRLTSVDDAVRTRLSARYEAMLRQALAQDREDAEMTIAYDLSPYART